MKLFHFAAIYLAIAVVVSADMNGTRYVIEREVNCEHVLLGGNSGDKINEELNDPVFLGKLLKARVQLPGEDFRVLMFGGDLKFRVSIWFPVKSKSHRDKIAATLCQYIEMRWRGISQDGAVALMNAPEAANGMTKGQIETLKREAPWLKPALLTKIGPKDLPSIFWSGYGDDYIFKDSAVIYLISFSQEGYCDVLTVDGRELDKENEAAFREAAKQAHDQVPLAQDGEPKIPYAYWFEIQDILKKKDIEWATPDSLNHRAW